jgi:hypothetical protein
MPEPAQLSNPLLVDVKSSQGHIYDPQTGAPLNEEAREKSRHDEQTSALTPSDDVQKPRVVSLSGSTRITTAMGIYAETEDPLVFKSLHRQPLWCGKGKHLYLFKHEGAWAISLGKQDTESCILRAGRSIRNRTTVEPAGVGNWQAYFPKTRSWFKDPIVVEDILWSANMDLHQAARFANRELPNEGPGA